MAMESRSKKARRSDSVAASSHVPHDDILHFDILPRLSFKSLCRFKSVCRSWRALISDDSYFAAQQSLHPSPTSSGFVYLASSGLEFLSAPDTPIGVPCPSIYIPFDSYRLKLVASTNGLLCCHLPVPGLNPLNVIPSFNLFYILNPATKEIHLIPATQEYHSLFVGLAFDPSDSPRRYALVCLHHRPGVIEGYIKTRYRFHVFSSETGKWVVSSLRVLVDDFMSGEPTVAVFTGGVLYWDCFRYLVWFDPFKNLAGGTPLPEKPSSASLHVIGVWEGRLTCTQVWNQMVEVFVMTKGSSGKWVRRHRASFEAMVRGNPEVFAKFCHPMNLRSASLSDRLLSRWFLRLLALDGGDKLYIGVKSKALRSKEKERVLCYDLRTGEMISISDGVRFMPSQDRVFSYHNSMVRIPELAGPR